MRAGKPFKDEYIQLAIAIGLIAMNYFDAPKWALIGAVVLIVFIAHTSDKLAHQISSLEERMQYLRDFRSQNGGGGQ